MSGNAHNRIVAIVLAGGASSRFGRLKQIEPVDDTCLLGIVINNAVMSKEIEHVILVLGAGADTVKDTLGNTIESERIEIVINDEYEKGLSSSLRVGLEKGMARGCDAAVFLLGDMPMVDAPLIDMLVSRYRSSDRTLCYVKSNGRPGHPIIARRELFDEFLSIKGDIGGREIVRRHLGHALVVDVGEGDIRLEVGDKLVSRSFEIDEKPVSRTLDIDTPMDMEIYRSHLEKNAEH